MAKENKTIATFKFLRNFRTFKIGDIFYIKKGLNIFVGDQGAGKSTLLNFFGLSGFHPEVIEIKSALPVLTHYFNFEKNNPRVSSYIDSSLDITSRFVSHGECTNHLLKYITEKYTENSIIIMDEPDSSLSLNSIFKFYEDIKKSIKNRHLVMSIHNPILIYLIDEIYDLENRCYMSGKDYIQKKFSNHKMKIKIEKMRATKNESY